MLLRLRHICLVATDMRAACDEFVSIFGLSACHSDPRIAEFGLENVLIPIGTSFLEIVSPIREGTAAGRYLGRRGGDGGYMAIFDSDEMCSWREHIKAKSVSEAAFLEFDGYEGLQLHPRDTGGPLLEINRTPGGRALRGPYFPAGHDWQAHVRTQRIGGLSGIEIQSDAPKPLAHRWASILLSNDPVEIGDEWHVDVDNAVLRFCHDKDGRGEGLGGIDLVVTDRAAIERAAADKGVQVLDDCLTLCGVRCHLRPLSAPGS